MSEKAKDRTSDNNMSAHVECTEICGPDNPEADIKNAPYLLVDYGEKLITEMETSKLELHTQNVSLLQKMELLWEVMRTSIILVLPVVLGLSLTMLSRVCLPSSLVPYFFTIFFGMTVGSVFINLPPLADSVSNYLGYKVYAPVFANCPCSMCMEKREEKAEKAAMAATGTVTDQPPCDTTEDIGCGAAAGDSAPEISSTMPDMADMD